MSFEFRKIVTALRCCCCCFVYSYRQRGSEPSEGVKDHAVAHFASKAYIIDHIFKLDDPRGK